MVFHLRPSKPEGSSLLLLLARGEGSPGMCYSCSSSLAQMVHRLPLQITSMPSDAADCSLLPLFPCPHVPQPYSPPFMPSIQSRPPPFARIALTLAPHTLSLMKTAALQAQHDLAEAKVSRIGSTSHCKTENKTNATLNLLCFAMLAAHCWAVCFLFLCDGAHDLQTALCSCRDHSELTPPPSPSRVSLTFVLTFFYSTRC